MEENVNTAEGSVIPFIDIGTNSIRMLLVQVKPNHSFTVLNQEKEVVRLGEGEFVDQYLQPEAMRRAVLVTQKFVEMAQAYNSEKVIAIATSATREAKNRRDFLRLLRQEAGIDVHTVSGKEEARLIYLGVSSGFHLNKEQALFIDIGGGSTEVIVGDQDDYHFLDSLKLGAIRLTTLFFLPEEIGPIPDVRCALIHRYIRNAAVRTLQHVRQYRLDLVIGSSGTIETLADIAAYQFFDRPRERDDLLTFDHLEQVIDMLCSLPLVERRKVPGLSANRADIIVAGALILHTLMEELDLSEIRISDRGLRDGLLVDYLLRGEHASLMRGMSVRERSVLQLGRASRFEEAHARHVARLALALFDSGKLAKLHNLGAWERELLEYAALLHDIGAFLSHNNHQAHTYYLIRNADLLGFDQTEINLMATVAYFHRKSYPKKKHPQYAGLEKGLRKTVRTLSVFLQLAESLDRSHASVVRDVRFRPLNRSRMALEIQADQDCQLEVWGVRNNKKAFKKTFGLKLSVESSVDEEG
jgi:exopolyphosphatase/guanosine-5'-triphosphate,3'-diphosphate pyrophosphatase